jgi:hypothetical protein
MQLYWTKVQYDIHFNAYRLEEFRFVPVDEQVAFWLQVVAFVLRCCCRRLAHPGGQPRKHRTVR